MQNVRKSQFLDLTICINKMAKVILFLLCCFTLCTSHTLANMNSTSVKTEITPVDFRDFWTLPDQPSLLHWQLHTSPKQAVEYKINDYHGSTIEEGKLKAINGKLSLKRNFPRGYYDIIFPCFKQSFGVFALDSFSKKEDPFFGIDSAMSWVNAKHWDLKTKENLIRLLKKYGISSVRERISWSQVNPTPGKLNWTIKPQDYDALRKIYAANGIKLLEVIHTAPKWTGASKHCKMPTNLFKATKGWQTVLAQWPGAYDSIEVWNEPDLKGFNPTQSPDQYAALVKAVYLDVAQKNKNIEFVSGVFARPAPVKFVQGCLANGILDFSNVLSFHNYADADSMEEWIGQYRNSAAKAGHPGIPIWITECGKPWPGGTTRPTTKDGQFSALQIVAKATEAKACGIEKYFSFIYVYYDEGKRNFGMIGKYNTPARPTAAYFNQISILSGMNYIGDLKHNGSSNIEKCRVFASPDKKKCVAVVWKNKLTLQATYKPEITIQKAVGIDGRQLKLNDDGSVSIDDGLVYLWFNSQDLEAGSLRNIASFCLPFVSKNKDLKTNTRAMEQLKLSRLAKQEKPFAPVVLQLPVYNDTVGPGKVALKTTPNGIFLDPQKGNSFKLSCKCWNFSEQAVSASVMLTINGCDLVIEKPEKIITIPAKSQRLISWQIHFKGNKQLAPFWQLEITGSTKQGKSISSLFTDVMVKPDVKTILAHEQNAMPLDIYNLSLWKNNIARNGNMNLTNNESIWRLDASFNDIADKWVYPKFKVPKMTDNFMLVVRARALTKGAVRMLLNEKDGSSYLTHNELFPADGKWHTIALTRSDFALMADLRKDENNKLDMDQLSTLEIGMNTKDNKAILEISDIIYIQK